MSMRADGSDRRRLATTGSDPAWSPDGTRIAFARDNRVWTVRPDGTDERMLVDAGYWDTGPTWSPDGRQLAFVRTFNVFSREQAIVVMPAGGGDVRRVHTASDSISTPRWSPDGTRIAFYEAQQFSEGRAGVLRTVRLDGSDPQEITSDCVPGTCTESGLDWRPCASACSPAGPPDRRAPETSITGGPAGTVTSRDATFSFAADEPGARFTCTLDAVTVACGSPHRYSGLKDGLHRFEVTAVDAAGNADPSPAMREFTVDATPPDTRLIVASEFFDGTFSAEFDASEERVSFECRLDDAAFAPCTSPFERRRVPLGPHRFEARATDAVGNVETTPLRYEFEMGRAGDGDGSDGRSPVVDPPRPRLSAVSVRPRRIRARRRSTLRVRGTLAPGTACTGTIRIRATRGRQMVARARAPVGRDCRFRAKLTLPPLAAGGRSPVVKFVFRLAGTAVRVPAPVTVRVG